MRVLRTKKTPQIYCQNRNICSSSGNKNSLMMAVIKSENLFSYIHCSVLLKLINKSVLLRSAKSIAKIHKGSLPACPIDEEWWSDRFRHLTQRVNIRDLSLLGLIYRWRLFQFTLLEN